MLFCGMCFVDLFCVVVLCVFDVRWFDVFLLCVCEEFCVVVVLCFVVV